MTGTHRSSWPAAVDFDVRVPSGRLRAHRFGDPSGALVLCVPGLSANSRWFDYLAERLVRTGTQVVALDLRGRGQSSVTGPGTYGFKNHALDVLAAAHALGAERFDLVGHSMGAYVSMEAAVLEASTGLRRAVLIDGLGVPRYAAAQSIFRNLHRLDVVHTSVADYVAAVRSTHLVADWNEYWDRVYEYEVTAVPGGVRARTQAAPVYEDFTYGNLHDARRLWRKIHVPVLALRAQRPITGRAGFIVTEFDLRNFGRTVATATVGEIDANHYDIMTHPATLNAIRRFLDAA